jgi:hypothetical protein
MPSIAAPVARVIVTDGDALLGLVVVSTLPRSSTAAHRLTVGQETPYRGTAVFASNHPDVPELGSNVAQI